MLVATCSTTFMTSTSKKVFYPFCEAVLVKQLANGEFVTSVTGTRDGVELRINFKSKAVVVSTGGKPSIPRDIFNSISSDKLITADYFLRQDGFEAFISTLIKNPDKRNIVIIRGSHSEFSSAWVLLNGSSWFNHNKNGWDLTFDETPNARVYKCKNKTDWGNHFNDPYSTESWFIIRPLQIT